MKDGVPTGGIAVPDLASMLTGFQRRHEDRRPERRPAARPAARDHRPPGVRRDGRRRERAVAAGASGSCSPGGGGATCPARAGSLAPRSSPAPLSMLAMEAGWITTEVGRQPWVVYGVLRTSEAVTHAPGIWGIVRGRRRALRRRRDRPRPRPARDGAPLAHQRVARAAARAVRAARSAGAPRSRRDPGPARRSPATPNGGRHEHHRRADPLVRRHLLRRAWAAPTTAPGSGT